MKCYYEELGVERDASDGDIKTAYRKLALKWHPDKNLDCLDEAKERFQTLQQAYEVLSDPHERSWYDKHRDQILRGKNSVYEDKCLDVFQFFTVSCFKGYGDDANGFYSIYREVFNSIATEDAEFIEDEEELNNIPKFGDSTSNYEEVVGPFYAYWSAYCTKKTYTWLCPYDITEIKDRRILREIEKDMKKIKQKARKERNEEVRNLVSYVRKRDKRVQTYKLMLEERAALNRQKQEQNRVEQIRRRQQELEELRQNNRTYAAEDDDYEEELKKLELQYSDNDSCESYESTEDEEQEEEVNEPLQEDVTERIDDFIDNLYCVACNRAFKNKKAFANHETSKKHRDNVTKLKQEMHEEDNLLQQPHKSVVSDKEDIKEYTENDLKQEPTLNIDTSTEEVNCTRKQKKDIKKSKLLLPTISDEDNASVSKKFTEPQQSDDSEEDWTSTGNKKANKKNKNKQKSTKMKNPKNTETTSATNTSNIHIDKETGAKLVCPIEVEMPQHICATCHSKFESKNKLFAHLNITNHGVYIPKAKPNANDDHGKVKKSKGKRK